MTTENNHAVLLPPEPRKIDFGIRLPPCRRPAEVADAAARAEAAGFSHAWVVDVPLLDGRLLDPYMCLAACAQATTTMGLGIAITNPYIRHPLVTACCMVTLSHASQGRAHLGISTGWSSLEQLGLPIDEILKSHTQARQELREVIGLLRRLFAGETIQSGAKQIQLSEAVPVQICVAATGPRALHMAGEIADAVIMQVGADVACVKDSIRRVHAGAQAAGRDPAEVKIILSTFASFTDNKEEDLKRWKPLTSWFYKVTPHLVELAGEAPIPRERAQTLYSTEIGHALDWRAAVAAVDQVVPESLVRKFCLVGTPEEAVERLQKLAAAGVDQFFMRWHSTWELPEGLIDTVGREIIPAFQLPQTTGRHNHLTSG